MKKKMMILSLLLITVGFAAISTSLFITGNANIGTNDDDFRVYYSDAKVNGVQDLSVVESETKLVFKTTLDRLGQEYVLDYDVTNGSKQYDADLTMVCTGGNDYLSVNNEFDDETNLEALKTRSGKLTLTLSKSYTGADLDVEISCTINANAVERTTLAEGEAADPVDTTPKWILNDLDNNGDISIGDEFIFGEEGFNVIALDSSRVTLLAQYSLGPDYRQTKSTNIEDYGVRFTSSGNNGWICGPAPKEIDIQSYSTNPKTYVNNYVSFLQEQTGDTSITGDLITLRQLGNIDCAITTDYTTKELLHCTLSYYHSWIVNGQLWWTRSAKPTTYCSSVWYMNEDGTFTDAYYSTADAGVRPVITITKSVLTGSE